MSKGAPLLPPLGLSFKAKNSTAHRVRQPAPGEARVAILNSAGVIIQEKLGHLSNGGRQCSVRFEGELHAATFADGRWEYRLPDQQEEP